MLKECEEVCEEILGDFVGGRLWRELVVGELDLLVLKGCFDFGYQPLLQLLGLFEEGGGEYQKKFEFFLWIELNSKISPQLDVVTLDFFLFVLLLVFVLFVPFYSWLCDCIWTRIRVFVHLVVGGLHSCLLRRCGIWWGWLISDSFLPFPFYLGVVFDTRKDFWFLVSPMLWMVLRMSVLVWQVRRRMQGSPMKKDKEVSVAEMIVFLPFLLWFSIPCVVFWFLVFVQIWRSLEAVDHLLIRGLNKCLPRRYEAWWGWLVSVSYVQWRCWSCHGRASWSVWRRFWSPVVPIFWRVHCMSEFVVQERRWIQTSPMKRNEDDG